MTSHPVKARKNSNAIDFDGPMADMSWIGIHLALAPYKQPQTPTFSSNEKADIAMTTTFASLAWITDLHFSRMISLVYTKHVVSASSCRHGESTERSLVLLLTAFSPFITLILLISSCREQEQPCLVHISFQDSYFEFYLFLHPISWRLPFAWSMSQNCPGRRQTNINPPLDGIVRLFSSIVIKHCRIIFISIILFFLSFFLHFRHALFS